jgi:hypothetical protein
MLLPTYQQGKSLSTLVAIHSQPYMIHLQCEDPIKQVMNNLHRKSSGGEQLALLGTSSDLNLVAETIKMDQNPVCRQEKKKKYIYITKNPELKSLKERET